MDTRKGPMDTTRATTADMANPFADSRWIKRAIPDDHKVVKQNTAVNEPGHAINVMDPYCKR